MCIRKNVDFPLVFSSFGRLTCIFPVGHAFFFRMFFAHAFLFCILGGTKIAKTLGKMHEKCMRS